MQRVPVITVITTLYTYINLYTYLILFRFKVSNVMQSEKIQAVSKIHERGTQLASEASMWLESKEYEIFFVTFSVLCNFHWSVMFFKISRLSRIPNFFFVWSFVLNIDIFISFLFCLYFLEHYHLFSWTLGFFVSSCSFADLWSDWNQNIQTHRHCLQNLGSLFWPHPLQYYHCLISHSFAGPWALAG